MMEWCTECFSDELEEFDDYIECMSCGAQFTLDSEQDDPEEYEPDNPDV